MASAPATSPSPSPSSPTPASLHLTTQQLEYLVAVSEAPTWAEAAASLGVTQSALSQGLSQLERRVGVPLFDRSGRRRVLQPGAEPVLRYARRVLGETQDLARWARAVGSGEAGQLRVGMIDLAAVGPFGPTVQRFRRERPEVELHLAVAPSAVLSEQVLAGDLSLAVMVEPSPNRGDLELVPLWRDDLGLYAPEGRPAGPPSTWGPWVTFPATSHTRRLIGRRLADAGAGFEVVAESHQPEVLRSMVALGLGWTVLPVSQAEAAPNPLRRAQPEPLMSRQLVVARRFGTAPDAAAEALVRLLAERAAELRPPTVAQPTVAHPTVAHPTVAHPTVTPDL